jgi:hypothetical protein
MRFTTTTLLGLTSLAIAPSLDPIPKALAVRQAPKGGARSQRADKVASLQKRTWKPPASMAHALDETWA